MTTVLPVLDLDRKSAHVHVVSGSFGAGHDAAAHEIEDRLVGAGHTVTTWDVVDLVPFRLGRLVRAAYLRQIEHLPGTWGIMLDLLQPGRVLYRLVTWMIAVLPATRLRAIDRDGADLFISTHPFASLALGRLRATGRLAAPAVTYLTDPSVHPLWVHPGIDLHLALRDTAAAQTRTLGGRVVVIEPLVPRRPSPDPRAVARVRRELGVDSGPLVLLTGGSLGIGELEQAALDVRASGIGTPVVLCGSNQALQRRVATHRGVVALGWRDDIDVLMSAADAVVQNAGGFMSLQALASSTPVVSYRCLPGHGRANATALEESGTAPWAHDTAELTALLAAAVQETYRTASALPVVAVPTLLDVLTRPRLAFSA